MEPTGRFTLAYDGTSPRFATPAAHVGTGAAVLGRASIGRSAWLGARSVIPADGHYVRIGDDFRLGARGTVHIAHDYLPTHIGNGVTAGANSVIHACDVGDHCHIGRDVVILDGSRLAAECVLADGSIVFPRSALEGGWLYERAPAKPVRRLEPGELRALHEASRAAPDELADGTAWVPHFPSGEPLFIAFSARLRGSVAFEGDNGIWFGCDLDAGDHEIRIGRGTNIQDNTVIRCTGQSVLIGHETTIGHNVMMTDCEVGDRSLIGMGSVVAAQTIVEDDVLLAAGAQTVQGQTLESGWLYGGSPARQLARLDKAKRTIIELTWPTYISYAHRFAAAAMAHPV
jgi:carbonic anhydrase/acetyltransferase-like protein (isoleucine patch superfamily)